MIPRSFTILPIPAAEAARLRHSTGVVVFADSSPGFPCRVCLRDAAVGDELLLVTYDPFADTDSPYRSASPVFVHRDDCTAQLDSSPIPEQLTSRQLSVRAFDAASMMLDGRIVEGRELAPLLAELAARTEVDFVHVHNAGPGCFAARVEVSEQRDE